MGGPPTNTNLIWGHLDFIDEGTMVVVKENRVDVSEGMISFARELSFFASHGQDLSTIGPIHQIFLEATVKHLEINGSIWLNIGSIHLLKGFLTISFDFLEC